MMRKVLGILMIALVAYGLYRFDQYWKAFKPPPPSTQANGDSSNGSAAAKKAILPGLPPTLEPSLDAAEKDGPDALKQWLEDYERYVRDPRLANIQMDYIVLAGPAHREEAKKLFNQIKQRITPDSPVYPRFKKLAKIYE